MTTPCADWKERYNDARNAQLEVLRQISATGTIDHAFYCLSNCDPLQNCSAMSSCPTGWIPIRNNCNLITNPSLPEEYSCIISPPQLEQEISAYMQNWITLPGNAPPEFCGPICTPWQDKRARAEQFYTDWYRNQFRSAGFEYDTCDGNCDTVETCDISISACSSVSNGQMVPTSTDCKSIYLPEFDQVSMLAKCVFTPEAQVDQVTAAMAAWDAQNPPFDCPVIPEPPIPPPSTSSNGAAKIAIILAIIVSVIAVVAGCSYLGYKRIKGLDQQKNAIKF